MGTACSAPDSPGSGGAQHVPACLLKAEGRGPFAHVGPRRSREQLAQWVAQVGDARRSPRRGPTNRGHTSPDQVRSSACCASTRTADRLVFRKRDNERLAVLTDIPGNEASVVTIGNFDGMHNGHKKVIATCVERAHKPASTPWPVTFDPPRFGCAGGGASSSRPLRDRLRRNGAAGLDATRRPLRQERLQPPDRYVDEFLVPSAAVPGCRR